VTVVLAARGIQPTRVQAERQQAAPEIGPLINAGFQTVRMRAPEFDAPY
jgi:hypothetical protein